MIIVVPLVQMLVLVFAANLNLRKIDVVVVDHDLSEASRQLVGKFDGIPFFNLKGANFSIESAEEKLEAGKAEMAMVIPPNFERKLIRENHSSLQLLINAIDGNSAQLIYAYSQAIISGFNKTLVADWKGIAEFSPPVSVDIAENYWFNKELDYKWYMAPGILAILVTVIGMFLSGMNLVREKEMGTIEQLNVTPIKKYQFILGKLIPFWVIALLDLALGLFIAKLAFNLPIVGSLWLLFGFAGLYLVSVLGLGLLISTLSNTQQQVMYVSFFFMMLFILMGGIFTPVESMPSWAQEVDRVNPIYYFMRIMRMVVLKGSGFFDLLEEFFSLLALGILFIGLAIWRYRKTA